MTGVQVILQIISLLSGISREHLERVRMAKDMEIVVYKS